MASSKLKRPLETSTRSGEERGQLHRKRPSPSPPTSNLQNHEISGSPGYSDQNKQVVRDEVEQAFKGFIPQINSFLKNAIQELVREEVEQANANLIEHIDSSIEKALKEFIPQMNSLKNAIQEHVCKGTDHANLRSLEQVTSTLPKSTLTTDTRNLQLRFNSTLSLPLYTEMQVKGQQGCPLQVELIDANTGKVVTSGPESCAKLDVVALKGEFNQDENDNWSVSQFEEYMVKEREGKRPLLTGELLVKLKEGIAVLGDLRFTDNSSWNSCGKFRIGAKVASGFCERIRVREAITEAFTVRHHRGEAYKKHYPPASDDKIWRLEEIGKGGPYCNRLNKEGIHIVEEFVRSLDGDSKKLKDILNGMPQKRWEALEAHARTCVPNGKRYIYFGEDTKDYGVVISNICQLKGFITGGVYYTTEQLSHSQKAHADDLVKAASKNWNHVEEFRHGVLASFPNPVVSKSLSATPDVLPMNQQPCDDPSDGHLTPLSLPRTESPGAPLGSSVLVSGDSTVGFGNANHDHSAAITLQSSILSHRTKPTSIIMEQDASLWSHQETFGNENVQCTVPRECPTFSWTRSSSFEGDCPIEELWPSFDNFGGSFMDENEYIVTTKHRRERTPSSWMKDYYVT